MKILILSNKLPYPPLDGGSIATLNMLIGLRDSGNEVTCLSLNTRKHAFPIEKIPPYLSDSMQWIGIDGDTSIRPLKLLLNLLFSVKPYIAERFNLTSYGKALRDLLTNDQFDLIQLEGPYLGHFLEVIKEMSNAIVSLRAHNVEHTIWKRKADNESHVIRKWYLKKLAQRLKYFEMQVVNRSDCLVTISEVDEARFISAGYRGSVITIPAGLSLKDYPSSPPPGDPTLFFIGALDWLPNQEGLNWFFDRVFGQLLEEEPGITFHIAGRNAPVRFLERIKHPNVVYHGQVENAISFMQSYRIMVVPLFTGSGIRIKILEGMAICRPVVTTTIGIEGIAAVDQEDILVADTPELFKDHIISLIREDDTANRMVARARRFIQENFDNFGLSSRLTGFFKKQV